MAGLKVLLAGPYPPPGGGVSVHVYEASRQLRALGIECRVLNVDRRAPACDAYLRISGAASLARTARHHAREGWTIHVHTNGHNDKSWLVSLLSALAGSAAPARVLTLHSGMVPDYLRSPARARLARLVCALFDCVVAVSPAIREALLACDVDASRIEVHPAFLMPRETPSPSGTPAFDANRPVLATAMFFRPEYGFPLLVDAVRRLRARHARLKCLVMGSGEEQAAAGQLVRDAGLDDAIVLLGNVSRDECLAYIARCDVFVRPTLTDGDSISVREALALGVPVVASNVGHRPVGTILFPAGNVDALESAIESALVSPRQERKRSAAAGIEKLLEIYGRVTGMRSGPRGVAALTAPPVQWKS